jgi:hypothetical protein
MQPGLQWCVGDGTVPSVVKDPDRAVAGFARVLKGGGYLVI